MDQDDLLPFENIFISEEGDLIVEEGADPMDRRLAMTWEVYPDTTHVVLFITCTDKARPQTIFPGSVPFKVPDEAAKYVYLNMAILVVASWGFLIPSTHPALEQFLELYESSGGHQC